MWQTLEYRVLCEAQTALRERLNKAETSDRDAAQLARALCQVVDTKRIIREAQRADRVTLAWPVKESLLVEATPDGTTPERG